MSAEAQKVEEKRSPSQKSSQSSSNKPQKQQGQRFRRSSRSPERRRFYNNIERWHYQRCSEIKIHFYVKNLYIGNQSEDAYLSFVRERVQKAGQCNVIQITGKNRAEQTIDIAIGMRYDQDAKLIYIGKKHINLASQFNINKNKNIMPVISNIFELLLEKNDELDKAKLEQALKRQRFKDNLATQKHGSSSSKSGSRSSSKRSQSSKSRSRSKEKHQPKQRSPPPPQQQPQIRAQQPIIQSRLVPPQQEIKAVQISSINLRQQQQAPQPQMSYKPVMLSLNENIKEQIQIFLIPKEFSVLECLQQIQDLVGASHLPEGSFMTERSRNLNSEQVFEYLEVTLEYAQVQRLLKNLPLRIKDLPCLVCQRLPDQSFREVLKTFQLFVSPAMRINNRSIYQHFKSFGEIVSFYTVESQFTRIRDAEDYIIIYAQESSIRALEPPGGLEITTNNGKVKCSYRYLDQLDIQFTRPPFSQTMYAQSQQISNKNRQEQPKPQPPQQTVIAPPKPTNNRASESSSSSSSSKKTGSSRSGSSESQNNNRFQNRRYDNRRRMNNQQGGYNQGGGNYNRNNNYRNNNNRGGSYDDDRRRGGGRFNQRQQRRYD